MQRMDKQINMKGFIKIIRFTHKNNTVFAQQLHNL